MKWGQASDERCFPQGCPFNMFNQLHADSERTDPGCGERVGDCGADSLGGGLVLLKLSPGAILG